ncbi:MAG: hypothetical protein P4L69_11295 [Desulfosporosinus sp.]|nr:hypothetical protein [Desulfosporosinus sp.]
MTSKSDKEALKRLKAAHEAKYGAPIGKRKCQHEYSEDCLGIAPELDKKGESQWRYVMCLPCYRSKQADRYTERLAKAGKVRTGKPGRPRKEETPVKTQKKKATKKNTKAV